MPSSLNLSRADVLVYTDAPFSTLPGDKSQHGYTVSLVDSSVAECKPGVLCRGSIMDWRSGRVKSESLYFEY